jgi:hypothetical protein
MPKLFSKTRRAVIAKGALGAVAAACSGLPLRALAQRARRQSRPEEESGTPSGEKVQPNDPFAQSVKYVENAAEAPSGVRKEDQFCHNCQFYQGDQQQPLAPCMIFMNKLVPAEGWCSTWVMKGSGASPR